MSITFRSTMVPSTSARYFMFLYKITRLAFVYAFMLLAVLFFLLHGFHAVLPKTRIVAKNFTNRSPLQILLSKELLSEERTLQEEFRENDSEMLKNINDQSILEFKKIVIGETVVPLQHGDKLADYVSKLLEASNTLSYLQASSIINMINLSPMQACIAKEETSQSGTLRNSAILAAIKRHTDNIHFMLIGVQVEPHLGWSWVNSSERNSWNKMLSRLLATKVKLEAQNYLLQDIVEDVPLALQAKVERHLALEQLLPKRLTT